MKGVNAKVHIMESGKKGVREEEEKEVKRHTHFGGYNLKCPQLITAHLWTQQSRTQQSRTQP